MVNTVLVGVGHEAKACVPLRLLDARAVSVVLKRFLILMMGLALLLPAVRASAGSLSFRLTLTGFQLTLRNQGDSSAFYPVVFRMLPDGRWERLEASEPPAELAAGTHIQFAWSDTRSPGQMSEFERLQPVMVRFFDQAGVSFGQISLLHPPAAAQTALKARYVDGALQIEPPVGARAIRASWVLWPREEGIGPIRLPVRFEHRPPPALRIDWQRQGSSPFRLDTGAGQPLVTLIHEIGRGYGLQFVPGGGLQGRQQRAAWLDATPMFYAASLFALAIAVGAMVVQFLRRPGRRPGARS